VYIVAIQLSARAARTGWVGTITLRFAGYANKVMNTSEFSIFEKVKKKYLDKNCKQQLLAQN
jgi:hypothetical protein